MADDSPAEHRKRVEAESEQIRRKRENSRRYRERHADSIRERSRQWKAEHPDKIKEYRATFRARHLEQVRRENRERERARAARARAAAAAAERRRVRARERYAADPQAHNDYQRERRKAQRAADPAGYRAAKNRRNKRWVDAHREEFKEKLRLKYRDNPEIRRKANSRYYAEHGEQVRERRRAYYAANREDQVDKQRQWRAREKRRREAGLPPRRLHRVPAEERRANATAADQFFIRVRSAEELKALRLERKTPDRERARLIRASRRERIAAGIASDTDPVRPIRMSQRRESEREAAARQRREADAVEAARMDAIAREINARLRQSPRRALPNRPRHAPTPTPPTTSGGLSL
jgi:hypothetical protein